MDKFLNKQIEYLKNRCVYPPEPQLKPVIYEIDGKIRYGIAIETMSNGWVVRQTIDKAISDEAIRYLFVGPADISYWIGTNDRVTVVEGMFDGLSAKKLKRKRNNILIFNSTANWRKAVDFIKEKSLRKLF